MRLTIFKTAPLTACLVALLAFAAPGPGAQAQQNPFAARYVVNDRVITNFDIEQRMRFLEVLNVFGDLENEAVERLIEERLQRFAARRQNVSVDEEAIEAGMAEFAARANLSTEEFIEALAGAGVAEETFRDFVEAGILWREVVRTRFAGRVNVTDAEIDRALSLSSQRGSARVLLSEIFLPTAPEFADAVAEIAPQIAAIRSIDEFADAARQFSAAPSGQQGGRVDWVPLGNLPEQLAQELLAATPGQVIGPIPVPNAIGFFQLRALETTTDVPPNAVSVEYARYLIPGGRSAQALEQAARVRARVDTCMDLNIIARGQPEEVLSFTEQRLNEVPADIALELARLDENESSVNLVQGDALVFLMLCRRQLARDEPPSRAQVRDQLVNQRLAALADGYLAELRAEADIRQP